ncbi:restriction endonuclease subunit S [Thioalkalivibrio paradoxus]|uniref:Restriction endonuclease subunit S n=1 Tax=Thioalkalivibrio paradoxus ARh 1 TaxID=713585 RepID=W0DJS1_9GAMM|nr:restriction endonuclease subunit S [Thioalkalivibrio paradoxus]AHE97228.1 restriction endonuclease subunit S [Thioalkalivibrio paradoxus ARh 1]
MNLGKVADVQMGYPFRSRLEHDPQGDVAVIQMREIDDTNLLHVGGAIRTRLPKGKTRHLLQAGDLLFRSRGRSNGAALLGADVGPAVLAAPMLLIRPHGILPEYLCWYINAPAAQARLAALSEGTSVRMISAEALKALEIPFPSLAVQQRIARIAALAEQEQTLLAHIASLRQRVTQDRLMNSAYGNSQ